MKSNLTTKVAALFVAVLMMTPDLVAGTRAWLNHRALCLPLKTVGGNPRFFNTNPLRPEVSTSNLIEKRQPGVKKKTPAFKEVTATLYHAKEAPCYLGTAHPKDPMNSPEDDVFNFKVKRTELEGKKVFLSFRTGGEEAVKNASVLFNGRAYKLQPIHEQGAGEEIRVELPAQALAETFQSVVFSALAPFPAMNISKVTLYAQQEKEAAVNYQAAEVHLPEAPAGSFDLLEERAAGERIFLAKEGDIPAIPRHINNVSKGAKGFSLRGGKEEARKIKIGVDRNKLSSGADLAEVRLFFFSREQKKWISLRPSKVHTAELMLEAEAPGNTDYFAGLIKTPDMPEASAYLPTTISGIKAANPAEGMQLMQPPVISRTGEAALQYPLDIPKGRANMTPSLSLSYSSDRGTGWLGMGWDISVPQITIDTRWGVPTFPATVQEEVYLLNGSSLAMQGGVKGNRPKLNGSGQLDPQAHDRQTGPVRFFERTMPAYQEIERTGSNPTNYTWVVTTADRTKYYYGTLDGSQVHENAVLRANTDPTPANNNILSWKLAKVEDKWGNNIRYTYAKREETSTSNKIRQGGRSFVLQSIRYTGFSTTETGKYEIEFVTDQNARLDARVSMKSGTKELDDRLLKEVIVRYDGQEVKKFVLTYNSNGAEAYFKTLLQSFSEYRSGQLFYSHDFEYYEEDIAFEAAKETEVPHFNNNAFDDIVGGLASVAGPLSSVLAPSPINTTKNFSWNVGGSVGLGLAPGSAPSNSKTYTLSGRFIYGESNSKYALSLQDFNADGLPDLVYEKNGKKWYRPSSLNADGTYSFGSKTSIFFGQPFMVNKSITNHYGLDFVLPLDAFYFGLNYNRTKSYVDNYFNDYNGDGIPDIVHLRNNKRLIAFGSLLDNGEVTYGLSSLNTPNPALKGVEVTVADMQEEALQDMELVKIWEAPFEGEVQLTGEASLVDNLDGEVEVAVQHDGGYLVNFQDVSPENPVNIDETISVNKGDYLLFRTRCKADGQQDLVHWDPLVEYTSTSLATLEDENGKTYGSSLYSDGFLLSGAEGVSFAGDQKIRIDWPEFWLNNSTDDVVLKAKLTLVNTVSGTETYREYSQMVASGTNTLVAPAEFKENGVGNTPGFFSSMSLVSGIDEDYVGQLSFEAYANSNVDWQAIDWRPKVSLDQGDCSSEIDHEVYPVVSFHSYNKLQRLEDPASTSGFTFQSTTDYVLAPILTASAAQVQALFPNADSPRPLTAKLVAKNGGKTIARGALELSHTGTITFKELAADGTIGAVYSFSNPQGSYFFKGADITVNPLYLVLSTESQPVADFLSTYLQNFTLFSVVNGNPTPRHTFGNHNIFYRHHQGRNMHSLHWGQFGWSHPEQVLMPEDSLYPPIQDLVNDYDFSGEGSDPDSTDFADLTGEGSAANPRNWKFHSMLPKRGEDITHVRSYVEALSLGTAGYDRWTVYNSNIYCGGTPDGYLAAGKLGETEVIPEPAGTPITNDLFMAYGAGMQSKSRSLAANASVAGAFSASRTIPDASIFWNRSYSSMMDFNGDGYQDILYVNEDQQQLVIKATDPMGGYTAARTYTVANVAAVTETEVHHSGQTVQGTYVNEKTKKMKITIGGSMGQSFGRTETHAYWNDFNGDGLPDRILGTGIELNTGTGLAPIANNFGIQDITSNTAYSIGNNFGQNLKEWGKPKQGGGLSFSAGMGLDMSGGESENLLLDISGDGLPDQLTLTQVPGGATLFSVQLNNGSGFTTLGSSYFDFTDVEPWNNNRALSVSARAAGSLGLPIVPLLAAHVKLSLSLNGNLAYTLNQLKTSFKDMNGDGLLDFVHAKNSGDIEISYAKHGRANKLKRVINPLNGSFRITYKSVGNQYGPKPVRIPTHETHTQDKMVWDMPHSKWVMASVTVQDGLDLQNTSAQSIDGSDSVTYFYEYDGGLHSRREKNFLGFSRIETRMPADQPGFHPAQTDEIVYLTEVSEYFPAESNAPTYRLRSEYLAGLLQSKLRLYNKEIRVCSPDPVVCETPVRTVKLIHKQQNTYEFRKVAMSGSKINQVAYDSQAEEWTQVAWNSVEEAECIFPAVVATESYSVPKVADQHRAHSQKFTLAYDAYTNLTEYNNEGTSSLGARDSVITDTIIHRHYEEMRRAHTYADLLAGNAPFQSFPSGSSDQCYYVTGLDGYGNDTVCLALYQQNPDPCFPSPSPGEGAVDSVFTYHRKLVVDTTFVWDVFYHNTYTGRAMARMSYFAPSAAAGQSNMLRTHKVYLGEVSNDSIRRFSEVELLPSGKAPAKIYHMLGHSSSQGPERAEIDLTYTASGKGNILSVEGSANHDGDRMLLTYGYDNAMEQYITSVTNSSYGESSCMHYDLATGLLRKTEDVNGQPVQYDYDAFYRLKSVYGPAELADAQMAPLMTFEYYPNGIYGSIGGVADDPLNKVPVAFTNHKTKDVSGGGQPPGVSGTVNCATLANTSGRPAITDPLQTATFIDGLSRVIQVKKDVSEMNGSHQNIEKRQVSGITFYDRFGRDSSLTLSTLEAATALTLGKLNNTPSGVVAVATEYDYAGRKLRVQEAREGTGSKEYLYIYNWNTITGDSEPSFFIAVDLDEKDIKSYTYKNSFGQTIATMQNDFENTELVFTKYRYDALNQRLSTVDPLGQITRYTYDNFGRLIKEEHPDRGESHFTYDLMGNLTSSKKVHNGTDHNLVTLSYTFGRLESKNMPNTMDPTNNTPGTQDVNRLAYTYGSLGDGKNGAGRVVSIVQGNDFKTENYEYDAFGNLVYEQKIIKIPKVGAQTFLTTYLYDAWGRVLNVTYPDDDRVSYTYTDQGKLERITAKRHTVLGAPTRTVVDKVLYDGYGNIKRLEYGNLSYTEYTYDARTRRLSGVDLHENAGRQLLDKSYTYDVRGNVAQVSNNVSYSGGWGFDYTFNYSYDDLNRLDQVSNSFFKPGSITTHNYTLDMTYNKAGGITVKNQTHVDPNNGNAPYPGTHYNASYTYNGSKPHQLSQTAIGQATRHYNYNLFGSLTGVYTQSGSTQTFLEELLWDEAEQLRGVKNTNGYHHFVYDQSGNRILKGSVRMTSAGQGGGGGGSSYVLDPYTTYVNPYYVSKQYGTGTQRISEVSKHYYMGAQRVATELALYENSSGTAYTTSWGVLQDLSVTLQAFGLTEGSGNDYTLAGLNAGANIEDYDEETVYDSAPCATDACHCAHSLYWAGDHGIDCSSHSIMYWYHPDYLGHNEYITDMNGKAYQYFWYSPFGESLYSKHSGAGAYGTPYKFNGKEEDAETGLVYYGARYYNAKLSVWLSVDPWAAKYPHVTPYNFVENNPVMLVDPTGKGPTGPSIGIYLALRLRMWAEKFGTASRNVVTGTSGNIPQTAPVSAAARNQIKQVSTVQDTRVVAEGVQNIAEGVATGVSLIPGVETFADGAGLFYSLAEGNYTDAAIYGGALVLPGVSGSGVRMLVKNADDLVDAAKAVGKLDNKRTGRIGRVRGNVDEIFESITQGGRVDPNNGVVRMDDGTIIHKHNSTKEGGVPTITINKPDVNKPYKIRVYDGTQ